MERAHVFSIFWGADPVVKLVVLILVGFSVVSWAIIVYKYKEFKRFRLGSIRFFDAFWKTKNLEDLLGRYSGQESPLFNIFRAAVTDILKKVKGGSFAGASLTLRRKIERAAADETGRVERYIPFLATTGSSTPFIGLFGTVWGILAAFWQIGKAGSTSLAVVGPFIAEALIATALGLAAAIPAVIAYNYFVARIRAFNREIEHFSEDLAQRIESEYFSSR